MRLTPILPLALAGLVAAPALAQTAQKQVDIQTLHQLDRAELLSSDGTRIGEVEDVLLDDTGTPVAVSVEIEDGFLDLGDNEVVFTLDGLQFENGNYVTSMAAADIEGLPRVDD